MQGFKAQWGDDLYPKNLQKIGLTGFYFIIDWPMGPKPFYVKVKKDDEKISESFDVMDRIEDLIKNCIVTVQNFVKENSDVEFKVPDIPDKIPRYKYAELIEKMQNAGVKAQWGDDLYPKTYKKLA